MMMLTLRFQLAFAFAVRIFIISLIIAIIDLLTPPFSIAISFSFSFYVFIDLLYYIIFHFDIFISSFHYADIFRFSPFIDAIISFRFSRRRYAIIATPLFRHCDCFRCHYFHISHIITLMIFTLRRHFHLISIIIAIILITLLPLIISCHYSPLRHCRRHFAIFYAFAISFITPLLLLMLPRWLIRFRHFASFRHIFIIFAAIIIAMPDAIISYYADIIFAIRHACHYFAISCRHYFDAIIFRLFHYYHY